MQIQKDNNAQIKNNKIFMMKRQKMLDKLTLF